MQFIAFAPFNFHQSHFPSACNSFQRILIKTSLHTKWKCLFGVFKEFQLFEVTLIRTPSGVADRERGGTNWVRLGAWIWRGTWSKFRRSSSASSPPGPFSMNSNGVKEHEAAVSFTDDVSVTYQHSTPINLGLQSIEKASVNTFAKLSSFRQGKNSGWFIHDHLTLNSARCPPCAVLEMYWPDTYKCQKSILLMPLTVTSTLQQLVSFPRLLYISHPPC